MALNSFQLFLNQLQSPSLADKHKMPVLKIVFDILMVHEAHFLGPSSPTVSSTEYTDSAILTFYFQGEKIIEFLMHVFENTELPEMHSLMVTGLTKLVLSGMIKDNRVWLLVLNILSSPLT